MYIEKAAEMKFFSYGIFQFRILPKTFLQRIKTFSLSRKEIFGKKPH